MNDRELDLLIQHVFGDAEGAEAAEAAKLAAGSPQEAALWAELKSDLRALNEVPECQMSVERLQHAILNKSQKEAAKGWSMAKVYRAFAFGATGVFALVIAMNLMKPASPENIVKPGGNSVAFNTENPSPVDLKPDLHHEAATTGTAPAKPIEAAPEARQTTRSNQVIVENAKKVPVPPDDGDSAIEAGNTVLPVPGTGTSFEAPGARGGSNPTVAMAADSSRDSQKPEDSVVIVESTTNQDGTRQAVEVSKDADVIFGG